MQDYTSIILILFILSLVSERIQNLIKLHIPQLCSKHESNSEEERNRIRNINWVSVVVGTVMAIILKADFFEMVESGKTTNWNSFKDLSFTVLLGCLLTGFFISNGSRFFHDLLDTVLYYKNVKRSLYNKGEILNSKIEKGEIYSATKLWSEVQFTERDDETDNHL